MAYTLQAIIGDYRVLESVRLAKDVRCVLPQGKALVPFTSVFRQAHGVDFLPLTDGAGASPCMLKLCSLASREGRIAYVEAEYFGGTGTQASMLWESGQAVGAPTVGDHAINAALHALGVVAEGSDEFDALGLGRFRNVDDWVKARESRGADD